MPSTTLDDLDRQLLTRLQQDVPLVPDPFTPLALALTTDPNDLIRRIIRLKDQLALIRQISGIFNSHALGYQTSLVAAGYHADRIDHAAQLINQHPGVSHNYPAHGPLNLWYTLAVPPGSRLGLQRTAQLLADQTAAQQTLLLPALRTYKIAVQLDLTASPPPDPKTPQPPPTPPAQPKTPPDPADVPVIRALQLDLPLQPDPFAPLAAHARMPLDPFLAAARNLQASGFMRRFAAILRHEQAGFTANVLAAWQVPPDQTDRLGPVLARFPAVSHCYLRPAHPQWPYNILTMIHGRTRPECTATVQAMAQAAGLDPPHLLWSLKEYKKTRLRYFTGDIEAWEARHA